MNPKQIEERILKAFELVSGQEKRRRPLLPKIELKILMLLQAMRPKATSAG
jgi:hypothetical protein